MSRAKARYTYVEAPAEPPAPKAKQEPAQKEKRGPRAKAAPVTRPVQGSATDALNNPAAYALPAQRRGKRDEAGVLKRTDVPREQLNVRIRPELKRAAAGMAALNGKTLGDVVEMALIAYLESVKQKS